MCSYLPRTGKLVIVFALLCGTTRVGASYFETTDNPALFQLQPFKTESTVNYQDKAYNSVSLINLNSKVNSWYLLRLVDKSGAEAIYNLLAVNESARLALDGSEPVLLITGAGQKAERCDVEHDIAEPFQKRQRRASYVSLCKDQLLLTLQQDGNQSTVEKGAQFLRWFAGDAGEEIINDVKQGFFEDRYLVDVQAQKAPAEKPAVVAANVEVPIPRALVQAAYDQSVLPVDSMGLKLLNDEQGLLVGSWYPLRNYAGFYASVIEPGMVPVEVQRSHLDRANGLDGVENRGMVYLMAFDLNKYSLGWGHGTDLPGVGWSERAVNIKRDNPYGPDGFDSLKPLVTLGHAPPTLWSKVVGTISGGFQRRHSAFRYGNLSTFNKAHHYGFMENGVLMVSPTEGLATIIAYQDGRVDLKTWTAQDNESLPTIRYLRQNGLPLVERDEKGEIIPGKMVKHWGAGNWSGSADKVLRTPRGAACVIEQGGNKYFVYAYFSGVTPSGIARVFQAYGCSSGIQLDMNSPGQAYASLACQQQAGKAAFEIEHLMNAMQSGDAAGTPRYWAKPDYKDFFYILKRE